MSSDPGYWRHWWLVSVEWWWRDVRTLVRETAREFMDDQCPQLAAGVSYYVLFSIFPLTLLFIAFTGLVLTDDSLRADLVENLFELLPLSEEEGQKDVEDAVGSLTTAVSVVGLFSSVIGLAWSASGMMGALRRALNQAWDTDYRRPFLTGKLLDLLMMLFVASLMGASVGVTVLLQVVRRVSNGLSDALGPLGSGTTFSPEVVAVIVPLMLSFATFLVVFRFVPSVNTRLRSVWPGALLSAVLFEVVKNGFAVYLSHFGNYDVVYGSLGTVIAFLFFVYINANIMLLGAELASEWPRVTHGYYDDPDRKEGEQGGPLAQRLRGGLKGLFASGEKAPDHIPNRAAREARQRRKADEIARRVRG